MMPSTFVQEGDTLSSIAARVFNGDWERFNEIVELNPDLDIFADLIPDTILNIPEVEQILQVADRELDNIGKPLQQISNLNIPILSGYADKALSLVGEINGVKAKAESVYRQLSNRNYKSGVKLVQWLLENR